MKVKDKTFTYWSTRPIIKFFCKYILRAKFYGLENIPKENNFILAGTHTHIMDSLLLVSSTKRQLHFLAKKELWKGWSSFYFKRMGMIPVDRSKKDENVLIKANEYLNNGFAIAIFPEGTTEKEKGVALPFKMGAVKMANETNTKIIPFAITGKYKFLSKNLKIKFGKPIKINSDLEKENKKLQKIVEDLRKEVSK